MYRGGKICQDIHFAPLWAKNTPKLGIAHALAMALGPWLAADRSAFARLPSLRQSCHSAGAPRHAETWCWNSLLRPWLSYLSYLLQYPVSLPRRKRTCPRVGGSCPPVG